MNKNTTKSSKQTKQKKSGKSGKKAGLIAFAVSAVVYALLFPLYRIGDFILCAAVSFLIGKVVSIMSTGLDLTTHNKPRPGEKVVEPVADLPLSGNPEADEVVAKGQEMLHQIRAENDGIPDEAISRQLDELERLCVQIFTTVAEKPHKAGQTRKFMNYYLPTTLKMLAAYRKMDERGVSGPDMMNARSETIRGMGMVLTACQKQLDNLYKDTMLDVSTDIDVLEQMLKRDGFAGSELDTSAASRATAAAEQMNASNPPTIDLNQAQEDDFISFYAQKKDKASK